MPLEKFPDWKIQWDIGEDELIPDNLLLPYEYHIIGGQKIVLSKLNTDTPTSGRKSAAKAFANTVVLKTKNNNCKEMTSAKGENINSRRDSFRKC